MRLALLAALLALSGCGTYQVSGAVTAGCHDGLFTSFCVVQVPTGSRLIGGTGIIPAFGNAAVGASITSSAARVP